MFPKSLYALSQSFLYFKSSEGLFPSYIYLTEIGCNNDVNIMAQPGKHEKTFMIRYENLLNNVTN